MTRRPAPANIRARPIVRPERLADRLVEAIRADVESGRVRPGDRLPSEMDLTAVFGVSRTVVREAISRLQVEGIVVSRQGSGVFVADASQHARSFRLEPSVGKEKAHLREIFELRLGVETEAAALAASRRNRAELAILKRALLRARPDGSLESGVEADVEFHRLIATAARNTQISRFLGFLSSVLTEAIRAARENSARREGWSERAYTEHQAIFDAIRSADPDMARDAMRFHLLEAQKRLGLTPDAKTASRQAAE